jgi:hypothetical protein
MHSFVSSFVDHEATNRELDSVLERPNWLRGQTDDWFDKQETRLISALSEHRNIFETALGQLGEEFRSIPDVSYETSVFGLFDKVLRRENASRFVHVPQVLEGMVDELWDARLEARETERVRREIIALMSRT